MIAHTEGETREALTNIRDYEVLLHDIYRKLSSMFPDQKSFWHNISVEESSHAFMVGTFISLYDANYVSFPKISIHFQQIQDEIAKSISFLDKISKEIINIKEAVEFALAAENSITEREIYRTSEDYPKEFNSLLGTLANESSKHYSEISRLYAKLQSAPLPPPPADLPPR